MDSDPKYQMIVRQSDLCNENSYIGKIILLKQPLAAFGKPSVKFSPQFIYYVLSVFLSLLQFIWQHHPCQ